MFLPTAGSRSLLEHAPAHGLFTEAERNVHINFEEIYAAILGIRSFVSVVRCTHIDFGIDNRVGEHCNHNGTSTSPTIVHALRSLLVLVEQHGLTISTRYVPTLLNLCADAQDYAFTDVAQSHFARVFPCASLHVFDGQDTTVLPRFLSQDVDPACCGIATLGVRWGCARDRLLTTPTVHDAPLCVRQPRAFLSPYAVVNPDWSNHLWYHDLRYLATASFLQPSSSWFRRTATSRIEESSWSRRVFLFGMRPPPLS